MLEAGKMRTGAALIAAAIGLTVAGLARGAYINDFESDTTGAWNVNIGPATTDGAADFFFDYSTVGIPSAPSGSGTRGLKLQANQSSGVFGGISVSPTGGVNEGGDMVLTFDAWGNFNGPFPLGGSGSTQMSTFGVGTSGTVSQWPGGSQDSIWFAATTDGNSASDYRAYSPTAPTRYQDTVAGIYAAGNAAGSTNASNAYYAGFGGDSAPAAQVLAYPQQTGATGPGTFGMRWHEVEIRRAGGVVTWSIDGLLIATVPVGDDTVLTGDNIFFGHADTNATSSTDPNDGALLFTLIDNVRVVPEPGSLSALGIGALGLMARRRKG